MRGLLVAYSRGEGVETTCPMPAEYSPIWSEGQKPEQALELF